MENDILKQAALILGEHQKETKLAIVNKLRTKYSISAICKVLGINRSIIYYKSKGQLPNLALEAKIRQIFNENRRAYGTRKIKCKLAEEGIVVSSRRIGQIMQKLGLVSCYIKHRPKQGKRKCNEDNCPNILSRKFDRDNTLDVVVSDLTYVSVAGKWHYICLLIDLWNREIIGWSVGRHKSQSCLLARLLSTLRHQYFPY